MADFVREEEAYHAATRNKNDKRAQVEAQVRAINNLCQAFPGITDALLEAAGLPVHKAVRAAAMAVPASAPEFQIVHPESRKITLPFHESGAGGGALSRGKPEGVQSVEFWVKVGAPAPATDADMAFLKSFQRSPGSVDFKLEDIGKPLWVSARWVNTRGQPGVFSPIQNTVIS